MRLLERHFTVKRSLETVWAHLEKVEQWPTWARHIRRIDLRPKRALHYDHQFGAKRSDETEVRFGLDGEGFGAGSFGRVFAAIYARNLDRAIPRLIRELEIQTFD